MNFLLKFVNFFQIPKNFKFCKCFSNAWTFYPSSWTLLEFVNVFRRVNFFSNSANFFEMHDFFQIHELFSNSWFSMIFFNMWTCWKSQLENSQVYGLLWTERTNQANAHCLGRPSRARAWAPGCQVALMTLNRSPRWTCHEKCITSKVLF